MELGGWDLDLDMMSPDAIIQGMMLQQEFDLLIVVVSSGEQMYVLISLFVPAYVRMLWTQALGLSGCRPHPALHAFETHNPTFLQWGHLSPGTGPLR